MPYGSQFQKRSGNSGFYSQGRRAKEVIACSAYFPCDVTLTVRPPSYNLKTVVTFCQDRHLPLIIGCDANDSDEEMYFDVPEEHRTAFMNLLIISFPNCLASQTNISDDFVVNRSACRLSASEREAVGIIAENLLILICLPMLSKHSNQFSLIQSPAGHYKFLNLLFSLINARLSQGSSIRYQIST